MSHQQLLLDPHVLGKIAAAFNWEAHWERFGYFKTDGFKSLAKAISRGDKSLEDQILCRWGVR